jgi:uncharacterized protein
VTDPQSAGADKIRVAVVTGGHPFDVPAFRDMFNRMPQLDVYIQDLDNWAASKQDGTYDTYDVFLFCNMHTWGVLSVREDMDQYVTNALNELGEGRQGIFVLHHALLAFPDLHVWSDICDAQNRKLRGFRPPEPIRTLVANREHPVTKGLDDWETVDEIFLIDTPSEASEILLRTDHPESMEVLAWVHPHKNARVLCYQAGHDGRAFTDPNYQAFLSRGIEWAAGRR